MTCGTCTHWKAGKESPQGFGSCAHGPKFTFLPMQHTCTRHLQLDAEKLAQRKAWQLKKGIK